MTTQEILIQAKETKTALMLADTARKMKYSFELPISP